MATLVYRDYILKLPHKMKECEVWNEGDYYRLKSWIVEKDGSKGRDLPDMYSKVWPTSKWLSKDAFFTPKTHTLCLK